MDSTPTTTGRRRGRPGPPGGRRNGLLAALVLLVLAGATAPAARAAPEPAAVAAALEDSRVYIDPALDGVISPAAARRLERGIRRTDRDVRIVLVRLDPDDRFEGRGRSFLAAVRSRLGKDGIFVVSEGGSYLTVEEYRDGLRRRDDTLQDASTLANFADRPAGVRRTLLEQTERLLALLREPPARIAARLAAYEKETEARSSSSSSSTTSSRNPFDDDGDDGSGTSVLFVLLAALLGGGGAVVVVVRRRRRGARAADGPLPVVPHRVFEHARAARRAELREDAEAELLELATVLDEQPVPDAEAAQDAYQRALDAYTAARRCAVPDAPSRDLVGILVLVDQARGDLARAATIEAGHRPARRTPLCAFHPLHGRSAKTVSWERGLQVPACAACAAAVRKGRPPEALRDGERPYFEADTVWARTGYGAFSDDLVERVSRGER